MKWSLPQRIDRFLRRSRMPPTRFGIEAVRDPQLVFQLRRGRKLRPPTAARVEAYLARVEAELGEKAGRGRR